MRKNQALPGASAGQKPCVLIVDDNQDALAALAELIDDFGFDVQVAYNVELALSMIHTAKPRCVVFDVDMPIMDGHALAQTLRTYLGRSVVLIGMSGHPPEDPRIARVLPLVDHWFSKPIDWQRLEAVLAGLSAT